LKIGILALQGAFARHAHAIETLGAAPVEVRAPEHLATIDALVMPGGESTTMSKLLDSQRLFDPLDERLRGGMPVLGTCAGMILLASTVLDGRADQRSFGAIDIDVRRNAYGRQVDSFETDLDVDGLDDPMHAVFIRAPAVERVGRSVEVLARVEGAPVLCASGSVLVTSFHPELTDDLRVHEMLLSLGGK
jgi:5'-phosphate synthase pdxT subunit